MKHIKKINIVIALYSATLALLLLSVLAAPLSIQWGWAVTENFIVGEEIIETILIAVLLGIFFFTLGRFKRALNIYHQKYSHEHEEKSKLFSRLTDASQYIGKVNVELQEINSIIENIDHYPKTKNEIRKTTDYLAKKAMTIARAPWIMIRVIDGRQNRIIKEHKAVRAGYSLPAVTMGTREIIQGNRVPGFVKIVNHKANVDLMTVCIMPEIECSDEERILIKLILDQIETYFLLYYSNVFSIFSNS